MSSSRIKSDEIQMGDNYVLPIEQTRVTRQQAKVQQIIDETDAKHVRLLIMPKLNLKLLFRLLTPRLRV